MKDNEIIKALECCTTKGGCIGCRCPNRRKERTMKTSEHLYFPIKNGAWLRDSQGKPRVYKSKAAAFRNLANKDYDSMQIYEIKDVLSREDFEFVVKGEYT